MKGGGVIDHPWSNFASIARANLFIRVLFSASKLNDTTNAFKAYRREVIARAAAPFLSPHFNLTVELPLKAIVRGYTWTVIPLPGGIVLDGTAKLKIRRDG